MQKFKRILLSMTLLAGLLVSSGVAASSASAAREACINNNEVKVLSSGVNVCFYLTSGAEYVNLPNTQWIYTGQYNEIWVNQWNCANYKTNPSCTYSSDQPLVGAHKKFCQYGLCDLPEGEIQIVKIMYASNQQ